MNIKILIGAINEKGLGKLQKDQEYDVPEEYGNAYIKNGWAEACEGKDTRDPATGNRKTIEKKTPKKEAESGKGNKDEKDEKPKRIRTKQEDDKTKKNDNDSKGE